MFQLQVTCFLGCLNQIINIRSVWSSKPKRLTLAERHKLAESRVLELLQSDAFQSEEVAIQMSQTVVTSSKLGKLAPFLVTD